MSRLSTILIIIKYSFPPKKNILQGCTRNSLQNTSENPNTELDKIDRNLIHSNYQFGDQASLSLSQSDLKFKSKMQIEKIFYFLCTILSPIPIYIDLGINKFNEHTRLLHKISTIIIHIVILRSSQTGVSTLSSKFSIFKKKLLIEALA